MAHKIRFSDLRTVLYETDGTGRDSYIVNPNGGFFKNKQSDFQNNFYKMKTPDIKLNTGKSQPKPIHYPSDGSGRDYYVTTDEGGISKLPGITKNFDFDNELRAYQKQDSWLINKPDWFQLGQKGVLARQSGSQTQKTKSQSILNQKLSKPKK